MENNNGENIPQNRTIIARKAISSLFNWVLNDGIGYIYIPVDGVQDNLFYKKHIWYNEDQSACGGLTQEDGEYLITKLFNWHYNLMTGEIIEYNG